jgi:hypothetical protein
MYVLIHTDGTNCSNNAMTFKTFEDLFIWVDKKKSEQNQPTQYDKSKEILNTIMGGLQTLLEQRDKINYSTESDRNIKQNDRQAAVEFLLKPAATSDVVLNGHTESTPPFPVVSQSILEKKEKSFLQPGALIGSSDVKVNGHIESTPSKPGLFPLLEEIAIHSKQPFHRPYTHPNSTIQDPLSGKETSASQPMCFLESSKALIPDNGLKKMSDETTHNFFTKQERLKPPVDIEEDDEKDFPATYEVKPRLPFNSIPLPGVVMFPPKTPLPSIEYLKCKYTDKYDILCELKEWFLEKFNSNALSYREITLDQFRSCVSLFVQFPKFCTSGRLMLEGFISIPQHLLEFLEEYDTDPIIEFLVTTINPKNMKHLTMFSHFTFVAFFKMIDASKSFDSTASCSLEAETTLWAYNTQSMKKVIRLWITPFLSQHFVYDANECIQSSELYTLWYDYLKTIVKEFKNSTEQDFKTTFLSAPDTRIFAKELKSLGFEIIRKASGNFYKGLKLKKKTDVSSIHNTLFDSVISEFSNSDTQYSYI